VYGAGDVEQLSFSDFGSFEKYQPI